MKKVVIIGVIFFVLTGAILSSGCISESSQFTSLNSDNGNQGKIVNALSSLLSENGLNNLSSDSLNATISALSSQMDGGFNVSVIMDTLSKQGDENVTNTLIKAVVEGVTEGLTQGIIEQLKK